MTQIPHGTVRGKFRVIEYSNCFGDFLYEKVLSKREFEIVVWLLKV